jgi:hypothetical protein
MERDHQGWSCWKGQLQETPHLDVATRCITEALRLYAADIFMGTYETSEMIDVTESYELDDDGNVFKQKLTNN